MVARSATGDEPEVEGTKFSRPPIDRLFFGCVLAATGAYVVFLIVMQLMPSEPEGADRQSYLGVVRGDSQPSGYGAGEEDPATGNAEPGGTRSGYYIGSDQPPRPMTQSEAGEGASERKPGAPLMIPSSRFERGSSFGGSRLGKLSVDDLVFSRVRRLVDITQ